MSYEPRTAVSGDAARPRRGREVRCPVCRRLIGCAIGENGTAIEVVQDGRVLVSVRVGTFLCPGKRCEVVLDWLNGRMTFTSPEAQPPGA